MMVIRFRSMEDLGPKQEKTAGWELVRLLRFDVNQDEQVTMVIDMKYSQGG